MVDEGGRGIEDFVLEADLGRQSVKTSGLTNYDDANSTDDNEATACEVFIG